MMFTRTHIDIAIRSMGRAVLLCAVAACADGAGNAPPTYEPTTGVWNYVNEGIIANSCGIEDLYTDPNTEFYLSNNGDGTFTILREESEDFDCVMSGEDFACPDRIGGMTDVAALSITVSWQIRVDGSFASETSMSGVQTLTFACDGDACDLAGLAGASFPCAYEYAFTAEKA